jgi:RyR domain
MYTTVKQIARQCHEANRQYCEMIGDMSQKSWDGAEQWQKDSAIKGVEYFLRNPLTTPEGQHKAWSEDKIVDGWVYGEVKDAVAKTHPCLVPYAELPVEQRVKDLLFQNTIRTAMPFLGRHIMRKYYQDVPGDNRTAGERLVDVSFTSGREDIAELKQIFADVADHVEACCHNKLGDASPLDSDTRNQVGRLHARVRTALEDASMLAVKMITR